MAQRKSARKKARKPARKAAAKKKAVRSSSRTAATSKPAPRAKRRQPESLRVRSVSIGLTVNDVAASMAWYRDVLGCVVVETWMHEGRLNGVTMRTGTATLFLGQDDWKKGTGRLKGEGIRLYFTTVQDVDALAAQIRARGGRLTHEPQDQSWGVRDFGIVDPDGFRITIQNES
jgi:uncharacterized glyoxalase superfamily protein PhnB